VCSPPARWARDHPQTSAPRVRGKRLTTHIWVFGMREIPGSFMWSHVSTCEKKILRKLHGTVSTQIPWETTVDSKHFENICNACLISRS
jgi:hypothetical protein